MKILHTSDWHLGRTLHGEDLTDAHVMFFDFLVEVVKSEGVGAILVAGDIFDRAVPAVETLKLAEQQLARLTELVPLVLTPGNHDSAKRLGFLSPYLKYPLFISATATPSAIVLDDIHGGEGVAIYGLPYLDPDEFRLVLSPDPDHPLPRRHQDVIGAALSRVRADARSRFGFGAGGGLPVTVMAHAFVTGADPSDSERDIAVGGLNNVGAEVFADFDYIALGHLHRPQNIGSHRLSYCGSPLPFSFSEAGDTKEIRLWDSATGVVESIPTPVYRPLQRIKTTIAQLESGAFDAYAQAFCEVTITDHPRPEHLYARVKRHLPHVLSLMCEHPTLAPTAASVPVRQADPDAQIRRFLAASGHPHLQGSDLISRFLDTAKQRSS